MTINIKYYFLFLNFIIIYIMYSFIRKSILINYKEYISKSKSFFKLNKNKPINNKNPFITICMPVYNMEKYIERSLLSIINFISFFGC